MSDVNITVSGQTYSPSSSGLMVPQNYKQQEVSQKRQMHAVEKIVKQNQVAQRTQRKSLLKTAGISFSVASVLKQSQIFTGVIGTIFQLIGALVDVILAPFLPIVVPILKIIGKWIPKIGDFLQNALSWIEEKLDNLANVFGTDLDTIGEKIAEQAPLLTVLTVLAAKRFGVLGKLWRAIPGSSFITRAIGKPLLALGKRLGAPLLTKLKAAFKPIATGLSKIGTSIAAKLAKSPIVKGIGSAVAKNIAKVPGAKMIGNLLKGGMGKLGGRAANVLRAGSAIPVLGAAIEGAYGLYKTQDDFRKVLKETGSFGKATAAAGGRLALTGALTGASLIDPSGIGTTIASIAGHSIMDATYSGIKGEIKVSVQEGDKQHLEATADLRDARDKELVTTVATEKM